MKVFIIAAMSVDGFIGLTCDHAADWTSKEDKQLFVTLTKEAGVMVMGSNTFQTLGRGLPGRKTIVYSRSMSLDGIEGDVEVSDLAPAELLKKLESEGYSSVAICGGAQIYGMYLRAGVVTDLYLTIEPLLFGSGIPLAADVKKTDLRLVEHRLLNEQSMLVHYAVGASELVE